MFVDYTGESLLLTIVIGVLALATAALSFSSCEKVEKVVDKVGEIKDAVDEVKDQVDEVKDLAEDVQHIVDFVQSLDDYQQYQFAYSCAVVSYRLTGTVVYDPSLVELFKGRSIYENSIKSDSEHLEHVEFLELVDSKLSNDPNYLMKCFNTWARDSFAKIGVRCAQYSLEKGYVVYEDYVDLIIPD